MTAQFTKHLFLFCGTENMQIGPSPYMAGEALVMSVSRRASNLVAAFRGTNANRERTWWHVTPGRANKLAVMFEAGFRAERAGPRGPRWLFVRNGVAMELKEALRAVEAMK